MTFKNLSLPLRWVGQVCDWMGQAHLAPLLSHIAGPAMYYE